MVGRRLPCASEETGGLRNCYGLVRNYALGFFAPHGPKLIRLGRSWRRSQCPQQGGSLKCFGDTMGS